MQTRMVGWIIAIALLVVGLTGCRNLPRGGGLGRGPDVRTIAGVGLGPDRLAVREDAPSTISSRVAPPAGQEAADAVVGQVVDDRGVPVSNARVRLAVDGAPGGREVVGRTNRSGQFLLKGLRPGDQYTLIAEWDDGDEFLLGRSSVSAPSEKVRIEVASVGGSDRGARVATGPRGDSSRTASFSREDRASDRDRDRERDSSLDPGRGRSPDPAAASSPGDRDEPGRRVDREVAPADRDRSGWVPADAVRRASLSPSDPRRLPDPDDDFDRSVERFGPNSLDEPEDDRPLASGAGAARDLGSPRRSLPPEEPPAEESSDVDPADFPLPMSALYEPGDPREDFSAPGLPEGRRPDRPPAPRPTPRPAPRPAPPRETADDLPAVRRFEPEWERDREAPDPPLMRTDALPMEVDPDDPDSPEVARDRSWSHPGAMRLPDSPGRPDAASAPGPASDPIDPAGDAPLLARSGRPEPFDRVEDRPAPLDRPSPPKRAEPDDRGAFDGVDPLAAAPPSPGGVRGGIAPEAGIEQAPRRGEDGPPSAADRLLTHRDEDPEPARSGADRPAGPGVPEIDPFPNPSELVEFSNGAGDGWPGSIVPEPEPESGPETPSRPQPGAIDGALVAEQEGKSFRWSDLPPPAPLERQADEAGEPEAGGAGRWSRGLLKLVSRERDQDAGGSRPAHLVQFDEQRERLQDFIFPDLNGRNYRLGESESDYVLLCFWGTWCDPCVAAMPHLASLQRQFGPDRLRVVSIAYERNGEGGPRSLSRLSRRLGLNYPILLAPTDEPCPLADALDVQYYPTLILFDRDGRVVHRETGATGDKLMRLDRAIAAAMDESVMTVTKR